MAFEKKKPSVGVGLLAIAKKKTGMDSPGDSTSMGDEPMDGGDDRAKMASDDLFDAVQSGDKDAFFEALKSAFAALDDDSGMDGDEGGSETAAV